MTTYGYRVMELISTPPRKTSAMAFTDPEPLGLHRTVVDAASAIMAGEKDEKRGLYTRIRQVRADAWGILITIKGGPYGELRELFDVENGDPLAPSRPVHPTDAVLSDFRVLFLVPPYGAKGLLISETRSRSHLTAYALKQLNTKLLPSGVKLRIVRDATDAIAWANYLDSGEAGVKSVELVQTTPSPDRTRFTNENVKKSRLQIDLVDGSPLKRRVSEFLNGMLGTRTRPGLAGIVGLNSNFTDEDFDEENIIIVDDGRERKIEVTGPWPSFTYTLDSDTRLSDSDFVDAVLPTAYDTLRGLNVDIAANWRPRL